MNNELLQSWLKWKGVIQCNFTQQVWPALHLQQASEQLSIQLRQAGICSGDIVALSLTNTAAFPVTLFSLLAIGCNPLLLNPASPQPEVDEITKSFQVHYLIHDFVTSRLLYGRTEQVFTFSMGTASVTLLRVDEKLRGHYTLQQEGVILHATSGTYGKSKFCIRPQSAAVSEARNYIESIDVYNHATITLTTPLHHAFAFGFGLASALLTNSTVRLYPTFNPRILLKDLKEHPGDILTVVPPMLVSLIQLAKTSGYRMSPHVFYAGSSCSESVSTDFQRVFNTRLYQIYGTTETGGISTSYSPEGILPGAGRPLKNVEVNIEGKNIYRAFHENAGEINVNSASMMQGYTHFTQNVHAWSTGDLGFFDRDGYLHLTGRVKDIINAGGSKIDPKEIEEVLLKHPDIIDAAVYPGLLQEDKEFVQAAIVTNGKQPDVAALTKYCYDRLTDYKVPVRFHLLAEIPRSAAGKCLKVKLPDFPVNYIVSEYEKGVSDLVEQK
ncbi:class I adenylate-forming enzyme family protein [Ohtaekwangia sp.]|uniref:class I adenylate-forming enzyme family protein n=1 Tax=Ohtaekwangia sp. TaxID=2066019 RepID=UPI002FDE76F5